MPSPKPLSPEQAHRTLANRFGPRADRLRQLATRFGIRPYRVFLVWSKSAGKEFGSGPISEVSRHEILPTPKVRRNLTRSLMSGGIIPMGSVELTEVSTKWTYEALIGRDLPTKEEVSIPPPYEFHYEVIEDGRGGDTPRVEYYRPFGEPTREPENVQWVLTLSPISKEDIG